MSALRTPSSSSGVTDRPTGLEVEGLEVVYQRGAEPAVSGIDLHLAGGEGLLVTGRPGSGCSSLVRALVGLVRVAGVVEVNGLPPGSAELASEVGYAPQGRAFLEGLSPRAIVDTVVRLRLRGRDDEAVDAALTGAGVTPDRWRGRDPDVEEVRRVALACAIAGSPASLILDDPWEFPETFAAIDRSLAAGGFVVVATRDPGHFPAVLAQTLHLKGGQDPVDDAEHTDG